MERILSIINRQPTKELHAIKKKPILVLRKIEIRRLSSPELVWEVQLSFRNCGGIEKMKKDKKMQVLCLKRLEKFPNYFK